LEPVAKIVLMQKRVIEQRQLNTSPNLVIFGEHVHTFGPKTKLWGYMFETGKVIVNYRAFTEHPRARDLAPRDILCSQLAAIGLQRTFLAENLSVSESTVTRASNNLADSLEVTRNGVTRALFDIGAHRVIRGLLSHNVSPEEVALVEQVSLGVKTRDIDLTQFKEICDARVLRQGIIDRTGWDGSINMTLGMILGGHIGTYTMGAPEQPISPTGPPPLVEIRTIETHDIS